MTAMASHAYQDLDKAIAVVEDKVILQSELNQRLTHLTKKQPDIKVTNTVKEQVLNQLILERLQLKIAERVNLNISDSEIDTSISRLKRRLISENNTLEAYLSQQEMDEPQLQKAIKHDLLLQKIQEGNINNRLRITEREIDEFLESKAGKEWTQTRFRLAHILLPIEGDGGNTAIAKAQKLVEQAEESSSKFQELAAAYSKGPNASKGGDLGWRMKNELPSLFLEQVATLKSGDISQPFRSNAGVHILKVIQRSGAEPVMVERFKVRHVLIKPTPLFTDAEAKAKIDGLYQQLLQDTDFNTLAKEYTEDTGSKSEGGDLGWSTPGKFVPVFENTMKETPLGEISKPFRSQFGWHILKVDDSRVEDMFDVVKRNQVVSILRKRRFQDELQLWLQELREDAYVEVLI
ncbi:MAG: peptidyl-prolyl cis-trans isomerase SurA [Cellvibrionaceae bacterium]|jgi:peptidyl-prolyl cis-trans isomerase SurA